MFENDWDVFFDPNDFGDVAVWQTDTEVVEDIGGIYEAEQRPVLSDDTIGVSAVPVTFTLAESVVPASWAHGDDFEVIGKGNFKVTDVQPDGSGMARVTLERA